jgi:hypothetical protein
MRTSSAWLSSAVAIVAPAVLLSSCGGSGAISNAPSAPSAVRDRGKTRVSPDAKRASQLVFTVDYAYDDINIFSLRDFKLKGTVTGFSEPQGMCSGTSGDVWVANTGTEQMLEYTPAGKEIASLTDSVGYPVGCAVDKAGDLAVTDIFGFSGAGQVLLYKHATGTPTELSNASQYYYYSDGFDTSSNLYVSGRDSSGSYVLSECAAGGTSCTTITISGGTIYFPGMVQWYTPGGYLAVGDGLCGDEESFCLYWVKISGSEGKIIGKTTFLGPSGTELCAVGGELDPPAEKYLIATGCGVLGRWHYPAGGKPKNSIVSDDEGVAISVK